MGGETIGGLTERIALERSVPPGRVALFAGGVAVPGHMIVDELWNASLTVRRWSPALTEDHRVDAALALLSVASTKLCESADGQAVRMMIVNHLERASEEEQTSTRTRFRIQDFLQKNP